MAELRVLPLNSTRMFGYKIPEYVTEIVDVAGEVTKVKKLVATHLIKRVLYNDESKEVTLVYQDGGQSTISGREYNVLWHKQIEIDRKANNKFIDREEFFKLNCCD